MRRTFDEETADKAVLEALRARQGKATRADLVVATALPEQTVERSLGRLLDLYDSAVGVAEGGTLVYRFNPSFIRRPERRPVLRALLGAIAGALHSVASGVRALFRALLAFQLLLYTFLITVPLAVIAGVIIGVVILIALLFSDSSAADMFSSGWVLGIVLGICILVGIGIAIKWQYGLLLQLLGARQLDLAQQKGVSGLVGRVAAFAMGPPDPRSRRERTDRTWTISQADEARVLARIRARGGRLRAGDLIAWLGLDFDQAEAQATRLCVEYGGEPAPITDEASIQVLEFRFPQLSETAGGRIFKVEDEPTRFERGDAVTPFTGNPGQHDLMVVLFALLNMTAGFVGWHFLAERRHLGKLWWLAWLVGALLPVAFSWLLLALPVARSPIFLVVRVRQLVRRARELMVKALLARVHGPPVDLERMAEDFVPDPQLPRPSPAELRKVALELGGAFELDDPARPSKTVWVFPRLRAELEPVAPAAPPAPVQAGTREGDGELPPAPQTRAEKKAQRAAQKQAQSTVFAERQQAFRERNAAHKQAEKALRKLKARAEAERRGR